LRLGDVTQPLDELAVVVGVGRSLTRVARRVDARLPSEGVDLEPGVVCDRRQACSARGHPRLVQRVSFERIERLLEDQIGRDVVEGHDIYVG
jgi:hypothetical protein